MTDDTKNLLQFQLSILQQTMQEAGVILGLAVDKSDVNNSKILFMDKKLYINTHKMDGFSISLTDFNRNLI